MVIGNAMCVLAHNCDVENVHTVNRGNKGTLIGMVGVANIRNDIVKPNNCIRAKMSNIVLSVGGVESDFCLNCLSCCNIKKVFTNELSSKYVKHMFRKV